MTEEEHRSDEERHIDVTAAEFRALFQAVSNWGRWGEDDERGTLNELSADRIAAAANLIRTGETVTLSHPLNTEKRIDNPNPAVHQMTLPHDVDSGFGTLRFAMEYIGVDYHHDTHSHIDALCHVALDGAVYNGKPSGALTEQGAAVSTIEVLENGLVGRGVLLDVPRLRGVPWLEPGEHVFPEDLEAAEREQGVTVGKGDVLLVRTGHARRLAELGPWDTTNAKAGLHPTTTLFLAERRVAALGSDGNSDTAPSTTEEIDFPIHALTLNAMGLYLLDYLQFEDLVPACERAGRWEFLFVGAPLRIVGGTGSPLNPIAIF
jgi:kynurenine formamidase